MKLTIDYSKAAGKIKPMNAVNNGPAYTKNTDQNLGNLPTYRAANIPFARTHDSSFYPKYGGYHTVDVHAIFPNFDADPSDPANYDFTLTDEYMETIQMAGTQIFYRLGSKIEHESKKYGILPPKDPHKWAVICEHIIAHLNEGWADGHHYGIRYWEIWNEPDLYNRCWAGTPEQFYDLFCITARHLKEKFPHLMIGGPAACNYNETFYRPLFERIRAEHIPFDFYSWHVYARNTETVVENVRKHRALLDEYGFTKTESILNEWNYVTDWSGEDWIYSLKTEKSIKGAAFIASVMAACQNAPVDMLMYYDARPNTGMNGLFTSSTFDLLKGYFPIATWGEMLKMGTACAVECAIPGLQATAARGENGETVTMISYFSDDPAALPTTFHLEILGTDQEIFTVSLLDEGHDMTPVARLVKPATTLTLAPNTVVVIR